MNHQEILKLKEDTLKNSIYDKEFHQFQSNILIVPELENDYSKFLADYDEDTYTDEDCIPYSTNQKFKLYKCLTKKSKELLKYLNQ